MDVWKPYGPIVRMAVYIGKQQPAPEAEAPKDPRLRPREPSQEVLMDYHSRISSFRDGSSSRRPCAQRSGC